MAERRGDAVSVLEVLENFFGEPPSSERIMQLRAPEIEELHDRVVEFSASDEAQQVPPDAIYPGAWIAATWYMEGMRPRLNQCLLYHSAIVAHDPISDFFGMRNHWLPDLRPIRAADGSMSTQGGPKIWNQHLSYQDTHGDIFKIRSYLASAIPYMFDLAPAIRNSVIFPRPQWKVLKQHREEMLTSVRHDTRNDSMVNGAPRISKDIGPISLWDHLQGLHVSFNRPIAAPDRRWEWQYEFFQLAKQLAFSNHYSTVYVPQDPGDLELLRLKIGTLDVQQRAAPRATTLEEIARIALPDLNLSAKTAVAIRKNDEDFEAWRRTIRKIDRDSVNDDGAALQQRVNDELSPIQEKIKKAALGPSLRAHLTGESLGAVLMMAADIGSSIAFGGDVDPARTAIVGASGGALGWLLSYRRPRLAGEARILSSLQRPSNTA